MSLSSYRMMQKIKDISINFIVILAVDHRYPNYSLMVGDLQTIRDNFFIRYAAILKIF